jgi:hypothetical protein
MIIAPTTRTTAADALGWWSLQADVADSPMIAGPLH